ncbi:hypothetical protein EPN95_01500 [Patescibacteria group bacterium]|nr:MAG: hypothetical protein EPN95_01500 [Patescibacteria group bacterium]
MSHGPESHHGHHERVIGPDEDGFDWPVVEKVDSQGNSHRAVHPTTYETTHRYPDGYYYTIDDNKDISRAGNRLYEEAHVKDPLAYGLYRIGEHGAPIRPESDHHHDDEALDLGAFAVDSAGYTQRTNNEKRDIDARATPIIASYEARDRALRQGKSIEEAQAIGADVYNIHFGMAGTPINLAGESRPSLPGGADSHHEQLTGGEPEPQPQARNRRFGRAATEGASRSGRREAQRDEFEEATDFLHDALRRYGDSAWLKQVSPEQMQTIIDEVRKTRSEFAAAGVTDKAVQDKRIYRKYRMLLETNQDADESVKLTHGILWDLMGENPSGNIPF